MRLKIDSWKQMRLLQILPSTKEELIANTWSNKEALNAILGIGAQFLQRTSHPSQTSLPLFLPPRFSFPPRDAVWDEAAATSIELINRIPCPILDNKSPNEILHVSC